MCRGLAELKIEGVKTTIPFHERLLRNEQFGMGRVHTKFVEDIFLKAVNEAAGEARS
jgi:acetyl-CoA carboxylase biotin carboxylase subunit